MFRLPQKAKFQCPSCGFSQLEPSHLISTYCRSCGDYYEVGPRAGAMPSPALLAPAGNQIAVLCFQCGKSHPVSPHAVNTICPCCNSAIDLSDMAVLSPTSRRVDTRGKLTIGPAGSLSSSWIICGSAEIRGSVFGVLRSEGEVRIATTVICACQITAQSVFIEKNARAGFIHPVETGHLEVRGHLTGIVHCCGVVHVRRGGRLEAEVHARSVRVEKGGALVGTCHVDGTQPDEPGKQLPVCRLDSSWPASLCPAC